jgi:lysozyme
MRKPTSKSVPAKRKSRKKSFWNAKKIGYVVGVLTIILVAAAAYHYRNGLAYYLGFKSNKVMTEEEKRFCDVRNFQMLNKYKDMAIGFDVSQYQEEIVWKEVKVVEDTFPLTFVFIRATVGKDKTDLHFNRNWWGAKTNKIIRGAYHYYRPNENSLEQAANFIKNVKLEKGDLPPVLDIEKLPEDQSLDSLKVGLKRWLDKVENHYKVKPIIYSGNNYYEAFLKEEFSEYTFWIANYNFFVEEICEDWQFWQFTEKASVKGIPCNVDINIYNGTPKMLQYMTIN